MTDTTPKKSLEMDPSTRAETQETVISEEVSQPMSELTNVPPSNSCAVQPDDAIHKSSPDESDLHGGHPYLQESPASPGEPPCIQNDETLPLAEQSTNEAGKPEVKSLPWAMSHDGVEKMVQEYEILTMSAFLMNNPERDFSKAFDESKHCHYIHLDGGGFGSALSPRLGLEGIPYIMMGNRRLVCHYGKPHLNSTQKPRGKHRLCTKTSKKVGCPSQIIIRHVILLQDFSFDKNKLTEHRRRALSKRIKASWKKKQMTTESRYYVEFPEAGSHRNHPLGEAAGNKQPIDKRVNEKMLSLIRDGLTSIPVIEASIREFVRDDLFKGSACPPFSNRRFYPTQKDIANRIFKVSTSSHSSKLVWSKLEAAVRELKERQKTTNGFLYFKRSGRGLREERYKGSSEPDSDCTENNHLTGRESSDAGSPEEHPSSDGLLFIYQSRHQQRLLSLYGCDLSLLDPVHRATGYPIPLYFLLVPTNFDYHVVGLIAMERESVEGLREALRIIKEANASWHPRQFMVDPSEKEIQIIESLFPNASVPIIDVRRHQAWQRWLSNPKHDTVTNQQELLAKMDALATARTAESYEAAMGALQGMWSQPKLKVVKAWFRKKWQSQAQRWAYVYRQQGQMLPLVINNGIESQRETLKYPYITENLHLPLHGILDLLIKRVLPEMHTRYTGANEKWSTVPDSTTLAPLLRNRPLPFIKHCQERIALTAELRTHSISQVSPSVFRVPGDPFLRGGSTGQENLVNLSIPFCTCDDFNGTGYPCVHMLACIADVDGGDLLWEQLPSSYLFSPFLNVDDGAATGRGNVQVRGLAVDDGGDDECAAAVSGISDEERATSSLEAILAAAEAQSDIHASSPHQGDASALCQNLARELLDLTHTVTDTEALASARAQMETAVATLRQALPKEDLPNLVHPQERANEEMPEEPDLLTQPPKRPRLDKDELGTIENHTEHSETDAASVDRTVKNYEDGSDDSVEANESIVTEIIDLQQGAVFILDPLGIMRNFQVAEVSTSEEEQPPADNLSNCEEHNYVRP